MPPNKPSLSLAAEVAKLAKLSHIQNGLPGALRCLPVAAVLAGEAVSQFTMGRNLVEERLMGPDEASLLKAPDIPGPVGTVQTRRQGESVREGILMMCGRCWSHRGRTSNATKENSQMGLRLGFAPDRLRLRGSRDSAVV